MLIDDPSLRTIEIKRIVIANTLCLLEKILKLKKIEIRNFKALRRAIIPLSDFTVILGSNGSGKSSVLQALHWAIQSARNPKVETNRADSNSGSTLSQNDADYIPSPDYKNASHDKQYGNFQSSPRMDLRLEAEDTNTNAYSALLWLKAARNEGTTVHAPSNNPLVATIRERGREFSTYIPGLAGIPLQEEKKSARIVHRQAAAGDANTVLRNLLLLLKGKESSLGKESALKDVEHYASRVMGRFSLQVDFNEDTDFRISANFQTGDMQHRDPRLFKPLELAGIGFLQVLQIFAYLVFYRPRLFLVDEPDSHLHPDRQEKLIQVLKSAAEKKNTQVILATHSPSVVRALDGEATVVWMKDGKRVDDEIQARKQMGWGLLDKKILILSEDKDVGILKNIVAQWASIDRVTAIWPLSGVKTLPAPESLAGMRTLFGDSMQLILHRDGDFLTESERQFWSRPYEEKGIRVWITPGSDVEACFLEAKVLAKTLGTSVENAQKLLEDAVSKSEEENSKKFSEKRDSHRRNNKLRSAGSSTPSDDEVRQELQTGSVIGTSVGKKIAKTLRGLTQDEF
ncbi:MAG: AAA family ATPase, partial [Bacteroidota bacterium]